jgi:hypothetical protein
MSDRLLSLAWRMAEQFVVRDDSEREAATVSRLHDSGDDDAYVWRQGRGDVTLRRDGDAWLVVASTIGRLLGPRQTLYVSRHGRADHAAWDVMARVNRFTRDELQVLKAGLDAAQWIRTTGYVEERHD